MSVMRDLSHGFHCIKKIPLLLIKKIGFSAFFLFYLIVSIPYAEITRSGTIDSDEIWGVTESPIHIQGDMQVPENISVTVEAGVEILIDEGSIITIYGQFDAQGEIDNPVRFMPEGDENWGALSYEEQGTGLLQHCYFERGSNASGNRSGVVNAYKCTAPVVIESCTFTEWPDDFNAKATQGYDSTDMIVRQCYFGPGENEAVHGDNSPILVEYNTFDYRYGYSDAVDIGTTQNPGPIIRYNTFLGGDDDAIDLDDCDAYVEGNLVMNHRGGSHDPIGISGDRTSKPIIVNNIIINCESGIGFKNGAQITCFNNTIVNCDKGFWMHQDPAHATVYNTIIWGKDDQVSIKLESGSTIDISYSIIKGDDVYPGAGNSNSDPLFADPLNQIYRLLAGSPAIDAGWDGEGVLNYDFLGLSRIGSVDIGAFEFHPEDTGVMNWIWME